MHPQVALGRLLKLIGVERHVFQRNEPRDADGAPYVTDVLCVGLTGGLGAGKSTVGRALAGRGATVIDADQVAREVVAPGSPGERAVLERFGPGVAGPDGHIDRSALAGVVFADPAERLALEAITHPLIRQELTRRVASLRAQGASLRPQTASQRTGAAAHGSESSTASDTTGTGQVVVVELPLLNKDSRTMYHLDVVVLVEAPVEVALARSVQRGMSEADARARTAAQPTDAERRSVADRVLVNDGDRARLESAVDDLWNWLRRTERQASPDGPS
jgi:dephospho-CoA kinase